MSKVNDHSLHGDELKKLQYQMKEFAENLVKLNELIEQIQ